MIMGSLAYYCGPVLVAAWRSKLVSLVLVGVWFAVPFTVQMLFNPSDVTRLERVIDGQPMPSFFSQQMLTTGGIKAAVAFVILALLILGALTLLYRRAEFSVRLWPVAALLVGVIGNCGWWVGTGFFDWQGGLVGWSPMALVVGVELVCERLGQDFIFGIGVRPRFSDVV
jgi:hypothetical protein